MSVTVPQVLVVISCLSHPVAAPDQNGFVERDWTYKDARLTCRREEMPMADQAAEIAGATPLHPDFSDRGQCARAGAELMGDYDGKHGDWYVRAVGCPTPIMNRDPQTGQDSVIGYEMPPCPVNANCIADPSAI